MRSYVSVSLRRVRSASIARAAPVLDDRGRVRMAVNIFSRRNRAQAHRRGPRDIRDSERRRIA